MNDSLELNSKFTELIDMTQVKIFEFGHVFKKEGEEEHFILGVKNPLGVKKPKEADVLNDVIKKLSEKLNLKLVKINNTRVGDNIAEFIFADMIKDLPEQNDYKFDKHDDTGLKFERISPYPFIIRDVAVFTPEGTKSEDVYKIIKNNLTDLAIKTKLFDVFTKTFEDGTKKTSYAYRIIFQSFDKTLSDDEINPTMEKITKDLNSQNGWNVR
jgi:phenylalanyl-tRNA synthetase beta subunit